MACCPRRGRDDPQPQVLDRIADGFSEHDALVAAGGAGGPAGRVGGDIRRVARRGPPAAAADDRAGVRRRRPGRDLGAEHLASGSSPCLAVH